MLKYIPISEITYESDRQWGGLGNIDVLTENIKRLGLINPPIVTRNTSGSEGYTLVAGRRRLEALKKLEWTEVPCIILEDGETEDELAEISLAENVNRESTHPLDEAAAFQRLLNSGMEIAEVARYYSRSVSGIYQRARLNNLIPELKELFRDEKMNLSVAAMLPSLTEEQQRRFFEVYGNHTKIDIWDVNGYLHQVQHCRLMCITDDQCQACKKRTCHTDPELFEDYKYLSDVCFDEKCYSKKWRDLIKQRIEALKDEYPDTKDILIMKNAPQFFPVDAKSIRLGKTEYALEDEKNHYAASSETPDSFRAWSVRVNYNSKSLLVSSEFFIEKQIQKNNDQKNTGQKIIPDTILAVPDDIAPDVTAVLSEKYDPWEFDNKVREKVIRSMIEKQAVADISAGVIADIFFDETLALKNTEDNDDKRLFELYTGQFFTGDYGPLKDMSVSRLFSFLTARQFVFSDLPEPDNLNKSITDESFGGINESLLAFSGIQPKDLPDLYRKAITEIISESIDGFEDSGQFSHIIDFLNTEQDKAEPL